MSEIKKTTLADGSTFYYCDPQWQVGWRIIKEKEFGGVNGTRLGKVVKKVVFIRYMPHKDAVSGKAIEVETLFAKFCCDPKMDPKGQGVE